MELTEHESIVVQFAENVSSFQFGPKIRVSKHSSYKGPKGWIMIVQGPVGGHMMNFTDGRLYHTNSRDKDNFADPNFYSENLFEVLSIASMLNENLGEKGQVVDFEHRFISKFLNDNSFKHLKTLWESEYEITSIER